MELRKYVNTCFKAEKVLSEVADVIGIVRYSRNMLCISENIVLCTACVFIASQIVRIHVTVLTKGAPCLITSGSREVAFAAQRN